MVMKDSNKQTEFTRIIEEKILREYKRKEGRRLVERICQLLVLSIQNTVQISVLCYTSPLFPSYANNGKNKLPSINLYLTSKIRVKGSYQQLLDSWLFAFMKMH